MGFFILNRDLLNLVCLNVTEHLFQTSPVYTTYHSIIKSSNSKPSSSNLSTSLTFPWILLWVIASNYLQKERNWQHRGRRARDKGSDQ